MSLKTSLMAVAVHAVVFYLLLTYASYIPILNMVEGFADTATAAAGLAATCTSTDKRPKDCDCDNGPQCASQTCTNKKCT